MIEWWPEYWWAVCLLALILPGLSWARRKDASSKNLCNKSSSEEETKPSDSASDGSNKPDV